MEQKIQDIPIKDLILWTENPRDPLEVGIESSDLMIIERAIKNDGKKWNLPKFIKEMGGHYDLSELPTVVKKEGKYIVFDGNRRIAILKYLQNPDWAGKIENKLFPTFTPEKLKDLVEIPCNICTEEIAIKNVYRKHSNSSSWKQLERDTFEHYLMGKPKSLFLIIEESTSLISQNPTLNENIMKNNVLTEIKLNEIGFHFDENEKLCSMYKEEIASEIFSKIVDLRNEGKISSRDNNEYKKYQLKEPLEDTEKFKDKIKLFNKQGSQIIDLSEKVQVSSGGINKDLKKTFPKRKTAKTGMVQNMHFFAQPLSLKVGKVNNFYRDIESLYVYYEKNKTKDKLSNDFCIFFRMSLRIFVEMLFGKGWEKKVENYFDSAKNKLSNDQKTTLSNNSVSKDRIVQLLHTGAHVYTNSTSLEQAMAMALIIGEIIKEKCEKRRL